MKKLISAALLCVAIASCKKEDTTSSCITNLNQNQGTLTTNWSYGFQMNGDLIIDTTQITFHQVSCGGMLSCRSRNTTEEATPSDLAVNPRYVLRGAGFGTCYMIQADTIGLNQNSTALKVGWFHKQIGFNLVSIQKISNGWKVGSTSFTYQGGMQPSLLSPAGDFYKLGDGFGREADGTVYTLMVPR